MLLRTFFPSPAAPPLVLPPAPVVPPPSPPPVLPLAPPPPASEGPTPRPGLVLFRSSNRSDPAALPGPPVPAPPSALVPEAGPTSPPDFRSGAEEGVLAPGRGLDKFWFETASSGKTTPGRRFMTKVFKAAGLREASKADDPAVRWQFVFWHAPPVTRRRRFMARYAIGPRRIVNHTPNDVAAANKDRFLADLVAYDARHGCDYRQLHPETFSLRTRDGCRRFLHAYGGATPAERGRLDIFRKEVARSGGRGIRITSMDELARREYGDGATAAAAGEDEDLGRLCAEHARRASKKGKKPVLAQRQVRPMLLDGRKFEMRVYLLVASFSPLRVFYQPGYVRRSGVAYDSASSDKAVHVLNTNDDGGSSRKWPVRRDFMEYVVRHYGAGVWWRVFEVGVRRALLHSLRAVRHRFRPCRGENQGDDAPEARCWTLLGYDVVVSSDLQLRVLEWNASPSVIGHGGRREVNTPLVDGQQRLVLDAVRLVAEAVARDEKGGGGGADPTRWEEAGGWELLLSEEGAGEEGGGHVWEGARGGMCFEQEPLV